MTHRPAGLVVALALLGIVAACSYLSWTRYVKFANLTRECNQAIAALYQTVLSIREAESSQRGYFLTHDSQYLDEYLRSVSKVQSQLANLQRLPADIKDEKLLASFIEACRLKLAELTQTITLNQNGQPQRAVLLVKSNLGLTLMTRITDVQKALEARMEADLVRNREASRYYARLSQYVSILGSAGIFLVVLLANVRIRRMIASTTRLNAELSLTNEDLRQFVYSASHDLQEPARIIGTFADLAVRRNEKGQSSERELGYVKRAATLMSNIIEDLLVYTQTLNAQAAEHSEADMATVAQKVLELLDSAIQEAGAVVSRGPLGNFPMSAIHAQIVLQNLLSNALKYRGQSTTPTIRIDTNTRDGIATLRVADNGIGIAPEYHAQIFGLFKRLHSQEEYPGTGLGLAICKKIAERYGGQIRVESELGKGTTFLVDVPLKRPGSGTRLLLN